MTVILWVLGVIGVGFNAYFAFLAKQRGDDTEMRRSLDRIAWVVAVLGAIGVALTAFPWLFPVALIAGFGFVGGYELGFNKGRAHERDNPEKDRWTPWKR